MTATVGFIGLGNMGWPMAARLAHASYRTIVFDVDRARSDGFAREHAAISAATPAEAANAEFVITMLPSSAIVERVLTADDGILSDIMPRSILIEMSSGDPVRTQGFADGLEARGAAIIDAPVSGGVPDAVLHFFADEVPFDHIVVSGADLVLGSVSNLALGDAYEAMRSKFWGAYHVARFARLTSHGSLTLVSGAASRRPNPQVPLIGAINAALESLAAGLAMEMAPRRVNAVSPGRIDTPFWRFLDPDEQEKLRERTASALPVGIVGLADHVAIQVIACMRNPYMTGSVIIVDGGYSIA